MDKKPLARYDPNSYRNRLPVEECRMPANNVSSLIIGDRSYFIFIQDKSITGITWARAKISMVTLEISFLFQILESHPATQNGFTLDKLCEIYLKFKAK